jgi:hypothetical protein
MEKPTCPNELRNDIVVIDLSQCSDSSTADVDVPNLSYTGEHAEAVIADNSAAAQSLHHGLELANHYLRKSVKNSTQTQVR